MSTTSDKVAGQGRVRVSVSLLRPGWVVDRDIFSGTQLLLAAGTVISPQMLISLRQRNIEWLDVRQDSELAMTQPPEPSDALTALLASSRDLHLAHGIRQAVPELQMEQAATQMEEFFGEVELGRPVNFDEIRRTVLDLMDQFLAHSDLAIKLLDLDRTDRYTYRHSINVGLLFLLVAKDWFPYGELADVVFGAVLHDLGKARVGSTIINKPGPLTDEEWQLMHMHPIWSYELLKEAGATYDALAVARSHHERLDGKGYPDGLRGDQLAQSARLAAICDVYDALTTKRSYKAKMDFALAIDIIIQGCGSHFDSEVANQFIRRVGRYPVGSFVRLSSGEVAIVVRVNEQAVSRPVVSRVLDSDGTVRRDGEELDLVEVLDKHITGVIPTPGSVSR
jgi:HD-GYP domain-containing protein (c-di-GMP phosphodiesterase class II)